MSDLKEPQDDQDPDYATPGPSNEAQQKLYEENARTNVARKITAIVEKEFSKEIDTKEKEILHIEGRLQKALKTLHFLRYVIITDFYNRKQCQLPQTAGEVKQSRIHPAIKQMIGKAPRTTESILENPEIPSSSTNTWKIDPTIGSLTEDEVTARNSEIDKRLGNIQDNSNGDNPILGIKDKNGKRCQDESFGKSTSNEPPKKIPRYVPPKSGIPEPQVPSRGARHKVRKRIIVGNISKWIPPDWREDAASHKWTMYVRGSKENADIADFVGKIRFFLHPSYRPNDVVEITSPPFHLSRRGWGEFPVRVQLHFKDPLNKPTDVIHYLKLDRTYTGLQTLGSETVVDVWIKASVEACLNLDSDEKNERTENSTNDISLIDPRTAAIKQEPVESERASNEEIKKNETSDYCERIKDETENPVHIPSHIYLEHDYANMLNKSIVHTIEIENNVTTSHSPEKTVENFNEESSFNESAINKDSLVMKNSIKNSTLTTTSEETLESRTDESSSMEIQSSKIFNGNSSINREFATIADNGEPEITIEACDSPNQDNDFNMAPNVSNKIREDVKIMALKLDNSSPKLQPLRIAIPAAFEALRRCTKKQQNRQILVLRDGKLIPIDNANLGEKMSKDINALSTVVSGVNTINVKNSTPQRMSLLKNPTIGKSVGKIMVKVNSNNSLILNATNNIPALQIVEPTKLNAQNLYLVEKKTPHRTTVGILSKTKNKIKESGGVEHWLDKYKVVARRKEPLAKDRIGTTSKRDNYEEILRSIDDVRITDVSALVRFVIRRLPLVTERATDPEYRNLHPYACASEKEFLDSNVGKQRAFEWYRAKRVRSFLKKKGIPEELQWTVKEIMIWSRLHGHTPIRSLPNLAIRGHTTGDKTTEKNLPGDSVETSSCTFTEPTRLLEFLRDAREVKAIKRVTKNSNEEVEVIDVEHVDVATEKRTRETHDVGNERKTIICLGIPEKIVALQSYVCETTRQIGIKLEPEEIVESVTHCAPARMMVRAVQCLLEDLLRSSLAKAWQRSSDGGCPDTITLEDVRGAILNREEFDVFTNEGLGSHHCPDD